MDKSKVCFTFKYEFRRETNAAQTTQNVNEYLAGMCLTNIQYIDRVRSSDLVILIIKMNHVD